MFFFCNLGLIIYTGLMSLRSRFRMSLKILMICIDLQSMLLDSREDRGGREKGEERKSDESGKRNR